MPAAQAPAPVTNGEVQRPRFAIVSAVYEAERYLLDFITSIERQTINLSGLEVIMVDDGSTDGSLEILRAWEERRPDLVRVLSKENGGQASARNLGLESATAEWVTFIDPDDWVNDEYFETIGRFIDQHRDDVDMIATNRIFFEEGKGGYRDGHPLRKMFKADQLVSLLHFPTYFQGSVPASFLRRDRIEQSGLRFDTRIRPNFEDGHFCVRYLLELEDPKVGFLKSAEYYYRKRADNSSTLATSVQKPGRFTDVPRYGYLDVLERSTKKFGAVPEWLQNMILYELSWYFSAEDQQSGAASAAVGHVGKTFVELLAQISNYFDEMVVRGFEVRRYKHIWRDILLHGAKNDDWHTPYVVLQSLDHRRNLVRISYRYTGTPPEEKILIRGRETAPAHGKTRTYEFFGQPLLFERSFWIPNKGTLRVKLNGTIADLRTSWVDDATVTTIRPGAVRRRFRAPDKVETLPPLRSRLKQRLRDLKQAASSWSPRNTFRRRAEELEVRLLQWRARSQPVREKYAGAWVLIDRIHDANDSAETLFLYLRRERPDINAWFVLERDTPDWQRLESSGCDRLIAHGSAEWKLLMLNCDKLISSHVDVPIHRPPEILRYRAPTWDFVFLQHGVIKDDISRWLNGKKLSLFVTSTQAEYESIAGDHTPYIFTSKEVALTGLPRFDAMQAAADRAAGDPKRLIIVAPTWRHWLNAPLQRGSQRRTLVEGFAQSEFAQNWRSVLDSETWAGADWADGFEVVMLPHPNLAAAVHHLDPGGNIRVLQYSDPDLHDHFAHAAVLVTDFSSMAFNAAYLRCPVVYFQFDREAVMSGGHVGRAGYFDYDRDGFGPVAMSAPGVIGEISSIVATGDVESEYRARIENAFPFRDGQCSKRVTEAIERL